MSRKFSIDKKRVKALYEAMLYGGVQIRYIAYNLGVKENTLRNWLQTGEALCENFEDKLEELEEIFPFMYLDLWENRKIEFEEEFKKINNLEDKIPDKLYNAFMQFMENKRKLFIESNISRKENEILEDIELIDDKELEEQYKLLIRFYRIYKRGCCTVEIGYLSNINRHAGTSKNIMLSMKMLERLNPENFADTQTVKHEGKIEVNNKSILSLALNYEREQREQQKTLPQNDTNILDLENIKQIEAKE